uniref:Candidate secreted effector n=1 Tax=Meloidogyne incognita TaxID=6306 RepID=A0A914NGU6_MELIC
MENECRIECVNEHEIQGILENSHKYSPNDCTTTNSSKGTERICINKSSISRRGNSLKRWDIIEKVLQRRKILRKKNSSKWIYYERFY